MSQDVKESVVEGGADGDTKASGAANSVRVLLAEDHKVNQMLATTMLENLGHTVEVAINGAEALEAVKTGNFQLVLMDIQMPVMNGVEAAIAIRKLDGDCGLIPVIAMTANAMHGDREQYLSAGMDDYLAKPIILTELAQKVQDWGVRKSATQKNSADS
jgi:two-component system, sensor histidine kinase and response regulator